MGRLRRALVPPKDCPCGQTFLPVNSQSVYCPACNTKAKQKERQKARHQRLMASRPKVPWVRPKHRTIVLFEKVWPAVRAEAERTGSADRALARLEHIFTTIPMAEQDGAEIVRGCIRDRLETVDAGLVGGPPGVAEMQRRGRVKKRNYRIGQLVSRGKGGVG